MSVRSLLELLLALTVASGYDGFPYQQGPAPHGLTRTYWSNLRVSTRDYSRKRQDNVHGRFYPSPSGHSAPWDVDMTPPLNHLSMSLAWGLGSTSGAGPTDHTPAVLTQATGCRLRPTGYGWLSGESPVVLSQRLEVEAIRATYCTGYRLQATRMAVQKGPAACS